MALTPKNSAVDVYSVGEDRAGRRRLRRPRVDALVAAGEVRVAGAGQGYFAPEQAVAAVRALRADGGRSAALLFDKPEFAHAPAKMPIAAASAVHAGIAATLILISTIGLPQAAETPVRVEPVTTRLVFIAAPGPGGGGGGGRSAPESSASTRAAQGQVVARQPRARAKSAETGRGGAEAGAATSAACRWSPNRCRRSWRRSQPLPRTRSRSPASSTSRRRRKAKAADLGPAAAWDGHRHRSRERRRVRHRRRIGRRDGRRSVSAWQRCPAAATVAGSEGRLHGEARAAPISKAKSCWRSSCAVTARSAM